MRALVGVGMIIVAGCASQAGNESTIDHVEIRAGGPLTVGQVETPDVFAYDAAGAEIPHVQFTLSSSDTTVAYISSATTFTARAAGSAAIIAAAGGKEASQTVTVTAK